MRKIGLSIILSLVMLLLPISAMAEEVTTTAEESEVAFTGKNCIAFGADLSDAQKATVLAEMGITEDQLSQYSVVTVTNAMEHQYLDAYLDSSVIGTKALSCVLLKETAPGSGIKITTKNIDYCTISMYKNALVTAGVENADVLVVGPSHISGTAGLIGVMNAYESISGATLTEEAKDTAMSELVTVGAVLNETTEDKTAVQNLIDYVKAEVVAGDITNLDEIKDIIASGEEKFGISLTEEQKNKIAEMMQKIADLDIDPSKLLEQAGDLYDKYGDTALKSAKEALDGIFTEEVKASLWESVSNFFTTIWNSITDFFSNK